ncbi:hypothetical protein BUZ43_00660 [Staphylococcus haemolyticus]|uniref:hypothetical protein n=1 Tax=Staphylococcus haemolyticus TaxID=1283 RepID=UPI000D1D8BE9|nr:hypothetical protein [Staphylococcus haemolyticus]PTK51077.1 hypothetical protein BUZ43_00660 [Staphylococcus haemolyticus]
MKNNISILISGMMFNVLFLTLLLNDVFITNATAYAGAVSLLTYYFFKHHFFKQEESNNK